MSDQSVAEPVDDALGRRIESQRARQAKRPTPQIDADGGKSGRNWSLTSPTTWQRWMRFLHVYTSMVAFIAIAFFGGTGLLLNHPEWLGGDQLVTETFEGTLPESVMNDDGDVEFLSVSEFLRSEHDVVGEVTNFDQIGNEASINYTGPAYGASARFDADTLEYTVRITEENFVNAMRDLHTGDDTNAAWGLTIDIAAGFLLFVAVSGLGIQLFMRKRRRRALLWLTLGTIATVLVGWLTLA